MKYIIEIPDDVQYVLFNGQTDNKCYTAVRPVAELEVLNSDYINEHYGQMQDEAYQKGINDGSLDVKQRVEGAYQRGLEDAWEAAQKVVCKTTAGGMSLDTLKEIFGVQSPAAIMQSNTAQQAIDKIKTYEDKRSDRIEVGDEVIWKTENITLIVTSTYEASGLDWCDGVAQDGKVYRTLIENDRKTGKHYDIASILEAMRE